MHCMEQSVGPNTAQFPVPVHTQVLPRRGTGANYSLSKRILGKTSSWGLKGKEEGEAAWTDLSLS